MDKEIRLFYDFTIKLMVNLFNIQGFNRSLFGKRKLLLKTGCKKLEK